MSKKLFSLIVLTVLLLPIAAFMNSCRRPCNSEFYCHYATGISLTAIDNGDSLPHYPQNGQLYAKALLLEMSLRDSLVRDSFGVTCFRDNGNAFLPSATAMMYKECPEDKYIDRLTSFTITSDKSTDAAHPAGTDLKKLFYCRDSSFVNGGTYNFYMVTPPATAGTHTFTITLTYANGKVLTASSAPVKLII